MLSRDHVLEQAVEDALDFEEERGAVPRLCIQVANKIMLVHLTSRCAGECIKRI